ncbi:hypothetical protein [Idiomarina aminovorans]|uniref:hypothetical protein n=1 Tax=Idiomarina aminovorans TaxID=2914829 RepID=UPI002003664B|nr:hypothetical protein [Idiomarina sp. ATCH4]MCK7460130.1 hypothetical protein [Idiomarina sp. ATCH4]
MAKLSVSVCGHYWWWQDQSCQLFSKALVVGRLLVLLPLTYKTEMGRQKRRWLWIWWFQLSTAQQIKLRRQLQQMAISNL